jgi:hypothetical protein
MTKEEVLAVWAPDGFPWSPWVKPVLFAHLELAQSLNIAASCAPLFPQASENAALVLDLPGIEGISTGIDLAKRGYRPVPLYNALPLPHHAEAVNPIPDSPVAALDMVPIISAIQAGAEILARLQLPVNAPPAFLLDANRRGVGRKITPGHFDNRSIAFVTDFPSAEFLSSHGIGRVILVQRKGLNPQPDLEPTLRQWQDGNIKLDRLQIDLGAHPEPFLLKPPRWYQSMFSSILSWTEPRPGNNGFGFWVPHHPSVG